jgi:hypothetical protein
MKCPQCKQELSGKGRFCGKCGYPIGNAAFGYPEQATPIKVPKAAVILAVALTIALFCLAGAIIFSANNGNGKESADKMDNTPTSVHTTPAPGTANPSVNSAGSAQYYETIAKEYDFKASQQQKSVDIAYESLQKALNGNGAVIGAQNYYNSACMLLKQYEDSAAKFHALAKQAGGK